jgi:hypothetical protein
MRAKAALSGIHRATNGQIRLPPSLEATSFDDLSEKMSSQWISEGSVWVVKPAVACGVHEAHEMALVLAPQQVPAAV